VLSKKLLLQFATNCFPSKHVVVIIVNISHFDQLTETTEPSGNKPQKCLDQANKFGCHGQFLVLIG
jgi:hypothetical protein